MSNSQVAGIGHNSGDDDNPAIAGKRLKSIVERYERLDEEKKALADDQKDIMAEAKSAGFDVKVIRELIRLRRMDPSDLRDRELLLDTYQHAMDMQ